MRTRRAQLSIAAVALLLGVLVVAQLRAQSAGAGLDALTAQELTVLIANLNTRNEQLRQEIATLERERAGLVAGASRGETSIGQLRADLARVRAWAGLTGASGPGVRVTVAGPVDGSAVEDLLNELRNAGAEAIAVGDLRVVPGTVVAGAPGQLSVEDQPLPRILEISAIGNPQGLVGSLTRAGGIVAQLSAAFPTAELNVTPLDRLELGPTKRTLVPANGRPRL